MTNLVALLYVVGFALILGGALWGWRAAHAGLDQMATLRQTVLDNAAAYYALPNGFEHMDTPGYAEAAAARDAAAQVIIDKNTADLKAAGFSDESTGVLASWLPRGLDKELAKLETSRDALRGPGLAALAGGLVTTVASVWSLYL